MAIKITIKASYKLPFFFFFLSTLFLASSSVTPLINALSDDHNQKCQQSICRGVGSRHSLLRSKDHPQDAREEYFYCSQSCGTSEDPEQCETECRKRFDEQLKKEAEEQKAQEEEGPTFNPNPYYFPKFELRPRFLAEEGAYFVLESFARLSHLLRGRIQNYRTALLQTTPGTFVLPYHLDAESIFVVWNGRGTLTFVMKDTKESFKIENGDVIRVPAGATTYLINNHTTENLSLVQLFQPVNTPDLFEEFFPAGYKDPEPGSDYSFLHGTESYYSVFSKDLLEAAFDVPREQLEKAFGQQKREGMIIRASQEQLEALSKQPSPWWRKLVPWSMGSDLNFNLLSQRPLHSNNYGKFYEAPPQEFNQLQDMNVSVAMLDINPEAMMVPHYNTKATYLMMVVDGMGYFEMACPKFTIPASEEEMKYQEEQADQQSGAYVKVSGKLSLGDVFVIPAGHPVSIVAQNNNPNNNGNQNQNLRIVGFGINAGNNMRNFLAGQEGNIMKQMEREATQLTFGQEMEQILTSQKQSYFVPASRRGSSTEKA
ncbi:unnamed protein product [Prunus armeniaca]|uniref:Cupin type-1 domain-containing protein n=1 Tax=Prunus armeniaca TaxID=36596 RepID=A0A6J5VW17_PRUAR|nr:unnamed protein product [Prunus armeniaca]